RMLVARALAGEGLGFFPEGTFDAQPGLKPFQPGAFGAAARAGLPIVPLVIHGARHKLPSGSVLPAPGPLTVKILPPIQIPERPRARMLIRITRRVMLVHLGEPDLGPIESDDVAYMPE